MLFSVIVPIYNVEKYIRQCVNSILNQTYEDFELILVDDGSPDGCPSICDDFVKQDNRVKVIHKENGGPTSARKAGILKANGDYIVCVDGDDFLVSEMLRKVSDVLLKSQYDIVCFSYKTVSDKKIIDNFSVEYRKGEYSRNQIESEIFPTLVTGTNGKRFPPAVWCKVFKKELLKPIQLKLSDQIILGEDSCLSYCSIYNANSIYILDEQLYCYRINNSSITRQRKKSLSWEEPALRAQFYRDYLPDEIFFDQIARITIHSLFNVSVSIFFNKRYREAKEEIKNKLKDPGYQSYIRDAKFKKNFKERFACFCIKHAWIFPIWCFSKLKGA